MSIVDVTAPQGGLVPGSAQQTITITFKLLNNNEPDLNHDVAGVDRATDDGINFNFASYIVDVNLTTSNDVINHQLTTVTEQLTGGDLQTSVDGVESEEFTIELTVHNHELFFSILTHYFSARTIYLNVYSYQQLPVSTQAHNDNTCRFS